MPVETREHNMIAGLSTSIGFIHFGMAFVFSIILFGCAGNQIIEPPPTKQQVTELFNSPRGTGQFDRMTYFHYESLSQFDSDSTFTITDIVPDIWFCNGICFFSASVFDESGDIVATFNSEGETTDLGGQFVSPFLLEANKTYRIYLHAWTTKSVGIFTTGANPWPCPDLGCLWTLSAFSSSNHSAVDHTDRGSIGFKFLGLRVDHN